MPVSELVARDGCLGVRPVVVADGPPPGPLFDLEASFGLRRPSYQPDDCGVLAVVDDHQHRVFAFPDSVPGVLSGDRLLPDSVCGDLGDLELHGSRCLGPRVDGA